MVIENAYALEEIKLGRRGENQARKVVFNVLEKWREGYGEGVASLIVQRNGDAQPYPVTVTEEDGALVWRVSSVDTAVAGRVSPTFEARRCSMKISAPTVVSPSESSPFIAWMAVFSISAPNEGVEKTSREPEPMAAAVS